MNRVPIVALIGRPNVGKSSLFNALANESSHAVTGNFPGVTRDRHYGQIKLSHGIISLVDTGGLHRQNLQEDKGGKNHYYNLITSQSNRAIKEASLILMVVDIREGRIPLDEEIARYLYSQNKEFWVLLNKCDSTKQEFLSTDFYNLCSLPENIFPVSAAHRRGLNDLKQRIEKKFFQITIPPTDDSVCAKVALLGAPNSGKSTLMNRLLKTPRAVVSPFPGTTIDSLEEIIDIGEEQIKLIDTAGIRKKRLIIDPIEKASVEQSFVSMEKADIILYLIDVIKEPGHQDRRLIELALERGKSVIILLNKVDLLTEKVQEYQRKILPCQEYCDVIPFSASKGTGMSQLFQCLKKTICIRQKKLPTGFFNKILQKILAQNPPRQIKIKYAVQIKSAPPTFILYTNSSNTMPENYRRYLKRELRRQLRFDNTPIHFMLRQGNQKSAKYS